MTEQQTTEPEATTEPEVDQTTEPENESPNSREARYRLRAKEAETERDTLRGQVEAMQRREVERLARADVQKPDALWSAGIELSSLLAEDGSVDPAKVKDAATDAAERLGLARVTNGRSPGEGSNGRPNPTKSFADGFKL